MRYLGIDYGSKRIGLAISDEEGKFAFPERIIISNKKSWEIIKKICEEKQIAEIVIGLSLNDKNQENEIVANTKIWSEKLIKLPIYWENEFWTSLEARRIQDKNQTDDSAAALILQRFLDRKNKNMNNQIANNSPLKNTETQIPKAKDPILNINDQKPLITFNDFSKLNICIGTILEATLVPDTEKLISFKIDIGSEILPIISGVKEYFPDPQILIGKQLPVLVNLEPKTIKGNESRGMILYVVGEKENFTTLEPNKKVKNGTKIK